MSIEELRKEKHNLEDEMTSAMEAFEKKSGILISSIEINHLKILDYHPEKRIISVHIEIV